MSYKIVVDSCCELPKELEGDSHFERVPLGLEEGIFEKGGGMPDLSQIFLSVSGTLQNEL